MIDVVIPVNARNAEHVALYTIPDLADATDIPLRFIVAARGGVKSDWNVVRETLSSMRDKEGLHYGLMVRDRVVTCPSRAVDDAIHPKTGNQLKHQYVLILRPEVSIIDKEWFGKMVSPLQRAPYVGGVFLPDEFGGSSTLVPHSMNEGNKLYPVKGVLTTRAHIEMLSDSDAGSKELQYDDFLQKAIVASGCARWMHAGVRFKVNDGAAWHTQG